MNGSFSVFLGVLLTLVGFTDNIWSWLTPLTPTAAAFDGLLIFVGAYFIFHHFRRK